MNVQSVKSRKFQIDIAIYFWYEAFINHSQIDLRLFELIEFWYSDWSMIIFAKDYLKQL